MIWFRKRAIQRTLGRYGIDTVQDGNERYDTVQDGEEQYGTVQDQMAEEDTEEVGESVTRRSGRRIKKPELYGVWKYGRHRTKKGGRR